MLLGLLVALVIWCWPAGPVWRLQLAEQLLGFSHNGRMVLTFVPPASNAGDKAHLLQREAASGRLINSTKLQLKSSWMDTDLRLSEDRKTLLVSSVQPSDDVQKPTGDDEREEVAVVLPGTDYLLVDVATGKPRTGAVAEVSHINPGSFSKDGRWLWLYHKPTETENKLDEIDIVSATDGEVVVRLRPDEDRSPWSCRFSEDGKRVAVLWRPQKVLQVATQVRVMDVLSGREERRFDLPDGKWQSIHRWDDRAMILEINVPDGDIGYFRRCREFSLSSSTLSESIEKPLLSGYVRNFRDDQPHGQTWWEDGPGWLVYATNESIPVTNWQATLARIDGVLGTRLLQERGDQRMSVRRVDPVSGWTISQISNIPFGWQPHFSDDGRWLAIEARGGIELWDTLPAPRWPWAIGLGLITTFGIHFVRRCFRRDAVRPSAGIPPVQIIHDRIEA